jgi:hypothetical protein
MKNIKIYALLIVLLVPSWTFTSCGSSQEDTSTDINIPNEDIDCCDENQEYKTSSYLHNLKELATYESNQSKYVIKVYSADSLRVGYNDIYFAIEKFSNGKHVKDFSISDITPTMTMGSMNNMQHSTPTGRVEQIDGVPVYHSWLSFLMPTNTGSNNAWSLSFSYQIRDSAGTISNQPLYVKDLSTGLSYLKSFKYNGDTYFLSLVNPKNFVTGVNTIKVYISKKSSVITTPYALASEQFTIEITPTMPDMGNHTSPNNEALTLSTDSSTYTGKINFTMTGLWNIHLVVKTLDRTVIAGGDNDDSGYSNLYWTVNI